MSAVSSAWWMLTEHPWLPGLVVSAAGVAGMAWTVRIRRVGYGPLWLPDWARKDPNLSPSLLAAAACLVVVFAAVEAAHWLAVHHSSPSGGLVLVGARRWVYRAYPAAAAYGAVLGWGLVRSWVRVANAWYQASCAAGQPVAWQEAAGERAWKQFLLAMWALGLTCLALGVWSWVLHTPGIGSVRAEWPWLYRFGDLAMSLAFVVAGIAGGILLIRMATWAAARRSEAGGEQRVDSR